jgi:hypothetical protein
MKTVAAGKSGASFPGRLGRETRDLGGRDVNALAVGGNSGLAETHSFSMQADSHLLFVQVVLILEFELML